MPQFSVIVPVYNVERYLDQCVKSILSQSFPDFELLLVNDGSTDGSLGAARKYLSDRRVRVFDKPHGGLGDTRNYGVKQATGKYLLFVDSDDWVDENMLRDLYSQAEAYRADLVVFNYVQENGNGHSRICRLPIRCPESGNRIGERVLQELIGPDPADGPWKSVEMLGSAWRRLYRRSWFLENGISYGDERKIMLEDLPASLAAHLAAKRLLIVGDAYYHYRRTPGSLSGRYRPRRMGMLTRCYCIVDRILRSEGLLDRYEERHLAWFLRDAVHSSLVNCFNPGNPSGFSGRYREVRGILRSPILRRALESDYLRRGSRGDRTVLRVLRTRWTPAVYLFYSLYSRVLRRRTD